MGIEGKGRVLEQMEGLNSANRAQGRLSPQRAKHGPLRTQGSIGVSLFPARQFYAAGTTFCWAASER